MANLQHVFFNPAIQFITTVIGVHGEFPTHSALGVWGGRCAEDCAFFVEAARDAVYGFIG